MGGGERENAGTGSFSQAHTPPLGHGVREYRRSTFRARSAVLGSRGASRTLGGGAAMGGWVLIEDDARRTPLPESPLVAPGNNERNHFLRSYSDRITGAAGKKLSTGPEPAGPERA